MQGWAKVALLGFALVVPAHAGSDLLTSGDVGTPRGLRSGGRSSGGSTAARLRRRRSKNEADDSCEFAKNGRCDVPDDAVVEDGEEACPIHTDCSDCGDCPGSGVLTYILGGVGIFGALTFCAWLFDTRPAEVAPEPVEAKEKWAAWQITIEDMSTGLGVDLCDVDTCLIITGIQLAGGIAAFNAGHADPVQVKDRIVGCNGATGAANILAALAAAQEAGLAATLELEGARTVEAKTEAGKPESERFCDEEPKATSEAGESESTWVSDEEPKPKSEAGESESTRVSDEEPKAKSEAGELDSTRVYRACDAV